MNDIASQLIAPPGFVKEDENSYYGPNEEFVMYPIDKQGFAVLDGAFSPAMLRGIANWIETGGQQ